MARSGLLRFFALIVAVILSACGLYTPDKDPFSSDAPIPPEKWETKQGNYESGIVDHVACEISQGLIDAKKLIIDEKKSITDEKKSITDGKKPIIDEKKPITDAKKPNAIVSFVNDWGVTVTLTITVEDQTGLSPGISLMKPLQNVIFPFPTGGSVTSPQSFSLSIGGTASVNALRTETIQFTVKNADLIAYPCPRNYKWSGVLIDGDLKIGEFIYDKAFVIRQSNGLWSRDHTPYNNWTEEITFVSSYGGTVTPTWKLARVSANASANLVVAQRTNTNDLIITFGPLDPCQNHENENENQKKKAPSRQEVLLEDIRNAMYPPPGHPTAQPSKLPEPAAVSRPGCPPEVDKAPLQLIASAMNQHNARVQATAIAVSITGQTH